MSHFSTINTAQEEVFLIKALNQLGYSISKEEKFTEVIKVNLQQ